MQKIKTWFKIAALAALIALSPAAITLAASSGKTSGASNSASPTGSASSANQQPNITRAYASAEPMQPGMIVGIDPASPNQVMPLSASHINWMAGVVVPAGSAPVAISNPEAQNQVFVATLGRYPVLVSDQNGAIKAGDFITVSALAGIGMKDTGQGELVVGKAVNGFDGKQNVIGNTTLNGAHGSNQKVDLGEVSVDLGIIHSPLKAATSNQFVGIEFLQQGAHALTGKEISPLRVYVSLAIFIIVTILTATILFGGVQGSMVATGRNPLARGLINKHLLEVAISAIVIFVIGLGAVYLVLKM